MQCGISFLYEAAVQEELRSGALKKLEPEDFSMTHDFSFVWQRGSFFDRDYLKIFEELYGPVKKTTEPDDIQ